MHSKHMMAGTESVAVGGLRSCAQSRAKSLEASLCVFAEKDAQQWWFPSNIICKEFLNTDQKVVVQIKHLNIPCSLYEYPD